NFQIDVERNVSLAMKSMADGQIHHVSYPWYVVEQEDLELEHAAESGCADRYGYKFSVTGDYAVMEIPTWFVEDEDHQCIEDFLLRSLDSLVSSNIEKLVIDVRGNGGGTNVWGRFAKRFMVPGRGSVIAQVIRYHKPGFPRYF